MPQATLRDELEKYYVLARRVSKQSLQGFLNVVSIETADKSVKRFQSVREPWQQQLLDPLIPAIEQATGLRTDYKGPQKFYLTLPKGHAKTTKIGLLVTWALCFSPRPVNAIVAAGDTGQANLLLEAVEMVRRENYWLQDLFKTINYEAKSVNSSSLEVLSSDADTASGVIPDIIICDEITFWKKRALYDILNVSSHKRPHCVFIIITNAGIIGSWCYEELQLAKKKPHLWYTYDQPGHKATWLSQARIQEEKEGKPPGLALRMYDNVWVRPDQTDAFATREQIEHCIDPTLIPTTRGNRAITYIAGLDLGIKKDRAVGTVVHKEGDTVVLDQMKVWVPQPGHEVRIADVEEWIEEVDRCYWIDKLILDPWNLEHTVQQYEAKIEIIRYSFQGQGHMVLAENLRQLIRTRKLRLYAGAGQITLPDGRTEDLVDEMSELIIEYKADNKTYRFNHLPGPGHHDDRTCSLALAALEAVREPEKADLNIHHLSLVPREEPQMAIVIRYPQIKHFPPHQSYQPIPVFQGETQYLLDYNTQEQAAYAVLVFHELVGLPRPEFEVILDKDPKRAEQMAEKIRQDVRAYIEMRRLSPPKKEKESSAAKVTAR